MTYSYTPLKIRTTFQHEIPLVGIAIVFTPSSFALDIPTAAPLALNVPVGIIPKIYVGKILLQTNTYLHL